MGRTEAELLAYIAARQAEHDRYSAANRTAIVSRARELGLALASHDDATIAHIEEAAENGVQILAMDCAVAEDFMELRLPVLVKL